MLIGQGRQVRRKPPKNEKRRWAVGWVWVWAGCYTHGVWRERVQHTLGENHRTPELILLVAPA